MTGAKASPREPLWPALLGAILVLGLGAAANLWFLCANCSLDLAGDEAHYWEWSRRLDWSYYSKGPLVAYIIAAGRHFLADWSNRLVGSEMLAVRVPAVALSLLTGLGLFFLTASAFRRPRYGLIAVLLAATVPICAAGSFLMTIDAPLICAWTWTLVCLERTLTRDRLWLWIAAGLLIAAGILAKYTMVLIAPVLLLAALRAPEVRAALRRPGVYIAAFIGLLGFAPIVVWNVQHDWVSFRHVAGQAGLAGGGHPWLLGPLEYVAGQALVTNPVWFVGMLAALAAWVKRPRPIGREDHRVTSIHLLCAATLVPWAAFLGFSPVTKIQPNWPAASVIPGLALLVGWGARRLDRANRPVRRATIRAAAAGAIIGLAAIVVSHRTEWLSPAFKLLTRGAPPWDITPVTKYDPTARLRGWSRLAEIDDILADERTAGREPFILTDDYQLASEIAFYCPSHPDVFCAQAALGDRRSQYDIWRNPIRNAAEFVGRPCVYVGQLHPELAGDDKHAAALPGLIKLTTITYEVHGLTYQVWSVYRCDSFAGFQPAASSGGRY